MRFGTIILSGALFAGSGSGWAAPERTVATAMVGETFGAEANPTGDPIGGGKDYSRRVKRRDYRVSTITELLSALKRARAGQVVYVDVRAEINLGKRTNILVPGGVTLAGWRGKRGRPGPKLYTKKMDASPLFRTGGPKVRITGLRIVGPDPTRRKSAYVAPNSSGILASHSGLEVDNCELSGWSYAAISLSEAGAGAHIHHNSIHHNQRSGLGYGVSMHKSEALIEANLFDWNRHHIAGTGAPGTSYEARYNLSLGHSSSYNFDMHGGRDRKDGTDIGGTWINIHHNTFRVKDNRRGVLLCGIPEQWGIVHHNWFHHEDAKRAASQYYKLDENMYVYRNLLGTGRRLLGTVVVAKKATTILRDGKAVADVAEGAELPLVGFKEDRFEVEFREAGAASGMGRGWVKASDAKIAAASRESLRARANRGLVAYYPFDKETGARVPDVSGNRNHGKIHGGAKRVAGRIGQALAFDGVDDYVDFGTRPSARIEKAGTLMFWFKPEVLDGGLLGRSTGRGWEDQRLVVAFKTVGEKLLMAALADGGRHLIHQFKWPKVGAWTHLAVTFDGRRLVLLQDGKVVSHGSQRRGEQGPVIPKTQGVPLIMGRSQGLSTQRFFKGSMDEVKVFSRALWEDEVAVHHAMTRALFPR